MDFRFSGNEKIECALHLRQGIGRLDNPGYRIKLMVRNLYCHTERGVDDKQNAATKWILLNFMTQT